MRFGRPGGWSKREYVVNILTGTTEQSLTKFDGASLEQSDLLKFVAEQLEALGITYMIVGSYGSAAYGEPRMTQDIDVLVDLSPAQLDALISRLPREDFYVSRDAALAAIRDRGQFKIIHPESSIKVDFMIAGADQWGREQLRAPERLELVPGVEAFVARPEVIIISKMLYYHEGGSEKHLRDIASMLKLTKNIDRDYVARWAQKLGVADVWEAILKR